MTTLTSQDQAARNELLASIADLENYVAEAKADDGLASSYVSSLEAELSNARMRLAQLDGTVESGLPTGDSTATRLRIAKAKKADALAKFNAKNEHRTQDTLFKRRRNPDYDWATDKLKLEELKLWTQFKSDLTAANAELITLNAVKSARFDAPENEVFDLIFSPELSPLMDGASAFKKLVELDDLVQAHPEYDSVVADLEGKTAFDALLQFARLSVNEAAVTDVFTPIFELAALMAAKNFSKSKNELSKVSETPMMSEWNKLKTKWNRLAKHLGLDTSIDVTIPEMESAIADAKQSKSGVNFNEKWIYSMSDAKRALGGAWDSDIEVYINWLTDNGLMSAPSTPINASNNIQTLERKLKSMQEIGSYKEFLTDEDPACAAAANAAGMTWQNYVAKFRTDLNAARNSASRKLPVTRNRN